eukprot:gnl/Chilomastix_cuspidata/4342.p1 GENE.gnl/Chilomastix_cuspidata/4342~~gnl/Chilomastix_cuspidata/4342.p1  ORF type:complete len:1303 (-),score=469.12 gnl/Chilomastix_cuspidata/4342:254-3970(-)
MAQPFKRPPPSLPNITSEQSKSSKPQSRERYTPLPKPRKTVMISHEPAADDKSYTFLPRKLWQIERTTFPNAQQLDASIFRDKKGFYKLVYPSRVPSRTEELAWLEKTFSRWKKAWHRKDDTPMETAFGFIDEIGRHMLARSIGEPADSLVKRFGSLLRALAATGQTLFKMQAQEASELTEALGRERADHRHDVDELTKLLGMQRTDIEELSALMSQSDQQHKRINELMSIGPTLAPGSEHEKLIDKLRGRIRHLEAENSELRQRASGAVRIEDFRTVSETIPVKRIKDGHGHGHSHGHAPPLAPPAGMGLPLKTKQVKKSPRETSLVVSSNRIRNSPKLGPMLSIQLSSDRSQEATQSAHRPRHGTLIPYDLASENSLVKVSHITNRTTSRATMTDDVEIVPPRASLSPTATQPLSRVSSGSAMEASHSDEVNDAPPMGLGAVDPPRNLPPLDFAIQEERRLLKMLDEGKRRLKVNKWDIVFDPKAAAKPSELHISSDVLKGMEPNPIAEKGMRDKVVRQMVNQRLKVSAKELAKQAGSHVANGFEGPSASASLKPSTGKTLSATRSAPSSISAFGELTQALEQSSIQQVASFLAPNSLLGLSADSQLYKALQATHRGMAEALEEDPPPAALASAGADGAAEPGLAALEKVGDKAEFISLDAVVGISMELFVQAIGSLEVRRACRLAPFPVFSEFVYITFMRRAQGSKPLCERLLVLFLQALAKYSQPAREARGGKKKKKKPRKKKRRGNARVLQSGLVVSADLILRGDPDSPQFDKFLLLTRFLINDMFDRGEVAFLLHTFAHFLFTDSYIHLPHPWIDATRIDLTIRQVFSSHGPPFWKAFLKELSPYAVPIDEISDRAQTAAVPAAGGLPTYKFDVGVVLWSFLFKMRAMRESAIKQFCQKLEVVEKARREAEFASRRRPGQGRQPAGDVATVTPATPVTLANLEKAFRALFPKDVNLSEVLFEAFASAALTSPSAQGVTVQHFFDTLATKRYSPLGEGIFGAVMMNPALFMFRSMFPAPASPAALGSFELSRIEALVESSGALMVSAKRVQAVAVKIAGILVQSSATVLSAGASLTSFATPVRPLLPLAWALRTLCQNIDAAIVRSDPVLLLEAVREVSSLCLHALTATPVFAPKHVPDELLEMDVRGRVDLVERLSDTLFLIESDEELKRKVFRGLDTGQSHTMVAKKRTLLAVPKIFESTRQLTTRLSSAVTPTLMSWPDRGASAGTKGGK